MKSLLFRIAFLLLAGCGLITPTYAVDIIVSAASSLTNAFIEIGQAYEAENAGTRVLFNFGASGTLLQQISRRAPVDVFASADQETMNRAAKQQVIVRDTLADFVANRLVLVAPAKNEIQIQGVGDLAKESIQRIGIGGETVPVGRYTKEFLEQEGKWSSLVSKFVYGQNVRQVLDYVARGEVDAGFVYLTDAKLLKDRVRVVSELSTKTPIVYPIAAVKGGGNLTGGREFVAFVQSAKAQAVLAKYGFLPAPK